MRWFKKKQPKQDWHSKAPVVFTDSKGNPYRQYGDEQEAPICRLDAADVVVKEIENRVSMLDLKEHLDNHNRILLSDQKPQDKLKQLADHTRWLEERLDIPAAPELFMKLPALFYIRGDEDPDVLDQRIWKEKVNQFLADTEGGYCDFFLKNGLKQYLPLSDTSIKDTEKLLMLAQTLAVKSRQKESELREALSL